MICRNGWFWQKTVQTVFELCYIWRTVNERLNCLSKPYFICWKIVQKTLSNIQDRQRKIVQLLACYCSKISNEVSILLEDNLNILSLLARSSNFFWTMFHLEHSLQRSWTVFANRLSKTVQETVEFSKRYLNTSIMRRQD